MSANPSFPASAQPPVDLDGIPLDDKGNPVNTEYRPAAAGRVPGRYGTVIPSAHPGDGGQSRGFSVEQKMPVHVDPEYADGFVLDTGSLQQSDVDSAVATTGNAVEALRKMSHAAEQHDQPPAPAAIPAGDPPVAEPVPIPEPLHEPLDQPMTSQMPEIDYDKLAAAMVSVPQPAASPTEHVNRNPLTPLTSVPAPQVETVQQNPLAADAKDPRDPLARELDIPFITGSAPAKPEHEVFFDLGPLGTAVGRYHGVVETDNLVVLLYDTRFEAGYQYLPPSGDKKPMSLQCPKISQTFQVVNAGLKYSLGCIDHLVLIKAGS